VWAWQVHHALKQQTLRRRRAPSRYLRGVALAVLVCRRCHERHESRLLAIPLERLPARVLAAASELGPWAEDLLRRYHPPSDAGRLPAEQEGRIR
jgi:hypothetical protein